MQEDTPRKHTATDGLWLRLVCAISRSDRDLARESNRMDRMAIGDSALTLLLTGTFGYLAWTATLMMVAPAWAAPLLALIPAGLILLLDRQIVASSWEYAGILQSGGRRPWNEWVKIGARVAVSLTLSVATSLCLTLHLFHDEISARQRQERATANAPLMAELASERDILNERLAGPVERELKMLMQEREALLKEVDAAQQRAGAAQQRASLMRVESGRQAEGGMPGYVPGAGPLYKEAQRQLAEANQAVQAAQTSSRDARVRMDALSGRIADKTRELQAASAEVSRQSAQLKASKESDSRFERAEPGLLSGYLTLQKLRTDPAIGGAVFYFEKLVMFTILILELAPLLTKAFAHATVYTVRLRARTLQEAAEVSQAYEQRMRRMQSNRARPAWRIVGLDASQDGQSGEDLSRRDGTNP